jgi:hypothetical protein
MDVPGANFPNKAVKFDLIDRIIFDRLEFITRSKLCLFFPS